MKVVPDLLDKENIMTYRDPFAPCEDCGGDFFSCTCSHQPVDENEQEEITL